MNRPPMPTVMRRKSSIPQATIKVSQEGNKDKVQRKSSKVSISRSDGTAVQCKCLIYPIGL